MTAAARRPPDAVGAAIAASASVDALDLLRRQHEQIAKLFVGARAAGRLLRRRYLQALLRAVDVHCAVELRPLRPALIELALVREKFAHGRFPARAAAASSGVWPPVATTMQETVAEIENDTWIGIARDEERPR